MVYRRTDVKHKRYIGLLCVMGIAIQIGIGVWNYQTQEHEAYFYLLELCILGVLYEMLIAKDYYSKVVSKAYGYVTFLMMITYLALVFALDIAYS